VRVPRRLLRWTAAIGAAILVLLQLKQVERTNPPVRAEVEAPPEIRTILRRSCYDCHSHETRWPWYSYVAPSSWFVADHVTHARRHMNLSEWPHDAAKREHLLEEIHEQVSAGEMPLASYLLLHRDARLSAADEQALLRWAGAASGE
jgi:hypothetical protein